MLANPSDSSSSKSAVERKDFLVRRDATRNGEVRHEREFKLLTATALWPRESEDRDRVRALAQQTLDWETFLDIVAVHRLEPIVFHNLSDYAHDLIPAEILQEMERRASAKGMAVFHALAEIFRLIKLLGQSGIEVRILKGIPLAILVYGDPGLREPGDIDLLILEGDIPEADRILQKAGYVRTDPIVNLTPRRFDYYIRHWKDFVYRNRLSGHSVELHWRLTRNRAMPGDSLARAGSLSQIVVGSNQIPTLAFADLFLYLCVHGALDGWMRLKSLVDIASLCRRMPPDELARLRGQSRELGILPEFSAAILLSRRIFDMRIECENLLPETDPVVHRILKFSWRAISDDDYRVHREAISGVEWAKYEWGLRASPSYRWQILQRVLFRPRVWARFPLPDQLFYLYPLLSPLEWALYHSPFR